MNSSRRTVEKGTTAAAETFPVFVYGTLMKTGSNNSLLATSRYLGRAEVKGFALYDLGSYPGVIPSKADKVLGEVYLVDPNTLDKLDQYEDEGEEYLRCQTKVVMEEGKEVKAFIYEYIKSVGSAGKVDFAHQPWRSNCC